MNGGGLPLLKIFFQIIQEVHANSKGHIAGGTKKTLAEVGKLYDCVPRSAVDKFVSLCLVCHLRKPQTTRVPLKPILSYYYDESGNW